MKLSTKLNSEKKILSAEIHRIDKIGSYSSNLIFSPRVDVLDLTFVFGFVLDISCQ